MEKVGKSRGLRAVACLLAAAIVAGVVVERVDSAQAHGLPTLSLITVSPR